MRKLQLLGINEFLTAPWCLHGVPVIPIGQPQVPISLIMV